MPSKTQDLEAAIRVVLTDGPLTVGEILDRYRWEDPRWIGVALMHLRDDGVIRCDDLHSGEGVVELVQADA